TPSNSANGKVNGVDLLLCPSWVVTIIGSWALRKGGAVVIELMRSGARAGCRRGRKTALGNFVWGGEDKGVGIRRGVEG
ncbi:hypothetical protein ACC810_39100, partial [Rhizobium ruizarguesonis]